MTNQKVNKKQKDIDSSERRNALKKIGIGIGAMAGISVLPEKWTRPIVGQITLPAHAATSAFSIIDPCKAYLKSGDQTTATVTIHVHAWIDPPVANLTATIWATSSTGAQKKVTTTTAADGTFPATITIGNGPGITSVSIVTVVDGADNKGHCSVSIPAGGTTTSTTGNNGHDTTAPPTTTRT